MMDEPQVLRPFHRDEVQSVAEAAVSAKKKPRTVRDWCMRYDIGRRICGQWAVSKVALAMLLEGDREALEAYLEGDRTSPLVTEYFERCGVPLPSPQNPTPNDSREGPLSELNICAERGAS